MYLSSKQGQTCRVISTNKSDFHTYSDDKDNKFCLFILKKQENCTFNAKKHNKPLLNRIFFEKIVERAG